MPRYNPAEIEPRWQAFWESNKTFATPRTPAKQKKYILDMFPYPSGDGLHVGHPEGYTATDIISRFERMRGTTVLHPMGFDAFGLPAEENAIKNNVPPRVSTEKNMANFVRQLKSLGFSYDWDRCLATTDVDYFKWTQWIFLELFDTWFDYEQQRGRRISELPIPADVSTDGPDAIRKYQDEHRLAYISEAPVNWCPALGTVLANEEVIGGLSERGQHPVMRLPLKQWMLRITAYGDRLENGLDSLQWPDSIKKLQRDWIGRSTGAEVDFYIGDTSKYDSWKTARAKSGFPKKPDGVVLRIYTTRPDTLFGATYMVIAPEHPAVKSLTTPEQKSAVETYVQQASFKSDLDRTELAKVKTGVFTGSYALNPVNGAKVPVWIADYVLISYGTGAIMAVPAHDERDFEFAKVYNLPIIPVVDPAGESKERDALFAGTAAFIADGTAINSGTYNGLTTGEMKAKITADLASSGTGRQAVNYKLRDWLFSRQRFWGEPFPILHEIDAEGNFVGNMRAVPVEQLPVNLPELADFKPHGRPEPPLEKAPADWLYITLDGKRYKRETNTMPQWAGSCWYFLRYIDPKNDQQLIDPALEKAWMPVDLYIGGAEHAVLHLLYSRFWHLVLFDRGHVTMPEPFTKLVNQGMILGEAEYHLAPAVYKLPTTAEQLSAAGIIAKHIPAKNEGDKETVVLKARHPHDTDRLINLTEEHVEKKAGRTLIRGTEVELSSVAEKMSKSRGNVVNPDTIVKEYGADSLRLYEMFMGPLEATKPWSSTGVNGVRGFLDRVWRLITNEKLETAVELHPLLVSDEPTEEQQRVIHKTIVAVTDDIQKLSFNTAIAKLMEYVNYFTKLDRRPKAACETLVLLLSPFAPHIAEELWQLLGHSGTLAYEPWPTAEERYLKDETAEIPVQINGKLRAKLTVATGLSADAIEAAARADSRVAELLLDKTVVKVICVPGKLINFVVK